MERLSDYLVFCDMDNTLLTAKEGISGWPMDAICTRI